jgi:hypothetical protein
VLIATIKGLMVFQKNMEGNRSMEARAVTLLLLALSYFSFGAGYRTENFTISGAIDARYAKQVGDLAEKYRKELALKWLGRELPAWPAPCPVRVVLKRDAEGRTSFSFNYSRDGHSFPTDWDMVVEGPADRILDAVLPHEITHTIFASHFGQPLPRWADEGGCTTVEHISERQKNHKMLLEFLSTNRGIPFNQMFRMKDYPRDILPLYAQGYSLARYFILLKGERHFIKYLERGMSSEDWDGATKEFYGFDDLSELQVTWVGWIKEGCPDPDADQLATADLKNETAQSAEPADLAAVERPAATDSRAGLRAGSLNQVSTKSTQSVGVSETDKGESWYIKQMQKNRTANRDTAGESRFKATVAPESAGPSYKLINGDSGNDQIPSYKGSDPETAAEQTSAPQVICSGGVCRILR